MSQVEVQYCTSQLLACRCNLPQPVLLCVTASKVAPHACFEDSIIADEDWDYRYISATVNSYCKRGCAGLGVQTYLYTFEYDDTQLVANTELTADDISGILCVDCLTNYIDDKFGAEPYIRTEQDDSLTFVSNHGCEYPLSGITPATYCTAVCGSEDELVDAILTGLSIIITAPITLTADRTIDTPVSVPPCGQFITNGFTLTINGQFTAGVYQCFTAADGEVVFGSGTVCDKLYPEWFGATGDGTTDDTDAIQRTINAARFTDVGIGNIPIQFSSGRTYMISALTITAFTVLLGVPIEKSAAVLKCNLLGSIMLTLDGFISGFTQNVRIQGLYFDGNDKATTVIYVKGAGLFECEDCQFIGGVAAGVTQFIHLDQEAIWNWFRNCEFVGNYTYGVRLTGSSCNQNTIRDCHFSGNNTTHAIYTDNTWQGDTLLVEDCAMEAGGCQDMVYLDHTNSGGLPPSAGNKVTISRCRFDRTVTRAHINVIRYTWGVRILDCRMVDPNQYNVLTDARDTTVRDCFLGNSTIAAVLMTVNSYRCHIGPNTNASTALFIVDQGGTHENWIFRKTLRGDTPGRPADMQPCEWGYQYLDDTLDADGLPIWWNGTAWVRYDGTVV